MISHCSRPWCGQALNRSLYLSQASKSDSPRFWLNLEIWFLRTAVLLGGKYLARNTLLRSSQVVIELGGRESNQSRALSLREKGNDLSRIASGEAPLHFKVSANCIQVFKC